VPIARPPGVGATLPVIPAFPVIPAKAGIQETRFDALDSCFRRNDECLLILFPDLLGSYEVI